MLQFCTKIEKCPLFNDKILMRPESANTYKSLYCKDTKQNWRNCKRYIVSEKAGWCPDFVRPNSMLSIAEIIERMEQMDN